MHESVSIAVTGAAGYIGSRVVTLLQRDHPEWELTAIDNFYHGKIRSIGETQVQDVDVRDRRALEEALDGADVVMHLAAISGVDDCERNADLAYDVNVVGTNNVGWFCRRTGAGLVFPFSMAVLGDPQSFPIRATDPRNPLNWYGRTKLLGERALETMADGAFPAHLFLKSNLYGEHEIDGERVSKGTVINFFVDRATSGETLTVFEPGTQARNFVHVDDIASAYVRSAERLLDQLNAGETGAETYEIASREDPSVMEIASLVQKHAGRVLGEEPDIELVENPREAETTVDSFEVDISRAERDLGWTTRHTVEESIQRLVEANAVKEANAGK